jgi:hypothetical protein
MLCSSFTHVHGGGGHMSNKQAQAQLAQLTAITYSSDGHYRGNGDLLCLPVQTLSGHKWAQVLANG